MYRYRHVARKPSILALNTIYIQCATMQVILLTAVAAIAYKQFNFTCADAIHDP